MPALRKTGHCELNQARLIENTRRETQVAHSKQVATFQHVKGGKEEIIRWYRRSSKHVSNFYPKEWMDKAQAMGMAEPLSTKWTRDNACAGTGRGIRRLVIR